MRFVVTNRDTFDSTRLGLEVAYALNKLYPGKIAWQENRFLIGNHEVLEAIEGRLRPANHPGGNGGVPGRFGKGSVSAVSLGGSREMEKSTSRG